VKGARGGPGRRLRYLLFHKPYGVLSQFTPEGGKACLKDYVDAPGVYPAGRLDWDSEGLLLLTNDGPFIDRIAAPRAKLPKVYWAQVEGVPSEAALAALRAGVVIEGKRTRPAGAERFPEGEALPPRSVPIRVRKAIPATWLRLTLVEGRNRQVRKMTAAVGHPTLRLIRYAIGGFTLDGLEPGRWREITAAEAEAGARGEIPTFPRRSPT
jgi:23S rRNA pseudouridine2457 synthase